MKLNRFAERSLPLFAVIGAVACTPLMTGKPDYDIHPVMTAADTNVSADHGYYESAVDAIKKRDYGLALDFLQAARAQNPNSAPVLNAFGVVYDKLGRFDLSARYYTEAKTADPQSTIVANNIAYSGVLQRLLNGDITPAQLAAAAPKMPVVTETETSVAPAAPRELAQVPAALTQVGVVPTRVDASSLTLKLSNSTETAETKDASGNGKEVAVAAEDVSPQIGAPTLAVPEFKAERIAEADWVPPQNDLRNATAESESVKTDFLFQPVPLEFHNADLKSLAASYHFTLPPGAIEINPVAPEISTTTLALEIPAVQISRPVTALEIAPAIPVPTNLQPITTVTLDTAPVENLYRPDQTVAALEISYVAAVSSIELPVTQAAFEVPAAAANADDGARAIPAVLSEKTPVVPPPAIETKAAATVTAPAVPKVTVAQAPLGTSTKVAIKAPANVRLAAAVKNVPVRVAVLEKPARTLTARPAGISTNPKRIASSVQKPVLLTHHPLVIVNASAQRNVADSIRRALARRNWTIAPSRLVVPRREAQTTLFYSRADYAVAKALARTLALPIHFVPNACHCVGLRLVIGTNALNRRYSELQPRTPLQVGALSTTLLGNKWQGSLQW